MGYNETPTTERETMTTEKFQSWPKPIPRPTTKIEDFGNGIFIKWKI